VVLALVTNGEGFVKYSRFFSGNTTDCTTLTDILTTLESHTGTRETKPIVALDAGIATEGNLALIKHKGYDYVCVSRTRLKDYQLAGSDPITLLDNRDNPIEIRMVDKKQEDEDTFLYVHSQQKALKEAAMKQHYNGHMETQLAALKASVGRKGGVKKYEKVMERIGRIRQRYAKAAQYYDITVTHDNGTATDVTWQITHKKTIPEDGVYFLRTSLKKRDERTLWKIYNTLSEIEASFRTLKTDLNLRPVFHKFDKTTEAHLFLGILAYNLVASIRYRLKAKAIRHDWRNIVRIMNTQKLVVTTMKNDKQQTIVIKACSQPRAQTMEIYNALKYKPMPYHQKKFVLPQTGI
jgi:transposase